MSVWRKEVKVDVAGPQKLGVSLQPIGDGRKPGDMVNVQIDLGIGLPFGGLMEWDESIKFADALKADGWEKDPEGTGGWKL